LLEKVYRVGVGSPCQKGEAVRHSLLVLVTSALLLTGCQVETRPGGGVEVVPILPAVVEIGPDGYFFHNGHHYFYDHDRWYYANSRDGEHRELPRSHWPRETHRRPE
jgi:hypothetical protein